MTPSKLSAKIVAERIEWINTMIRSIKSLPLKNFETFQSDPKNVAAAESYLRRALEALLDLGRHILARGFGHAVVEYKEIATALKSKNVLSEQECELLRMLAGYRNRMVHFYHEISEQELYDICSSQLEDIESVLGSITQWLKSHPDMIDHTL
jgi:uncharacterized protein YutE (UPF0331/DUF86 family)